MCVGTPMQVERADAFVARCRDGETLEDVDTTLVGPQPPGTWLLVFLGTAREVLTPARAAEVRSALDAIAAIARGDTEIDHLFADLAGREPELPAHLRPSADADGACP